MTIVTLNDRISKAEEKIAKKTATIAKKTALIEKKNAQIEKATDENTRYWLVCDTNHLREDILRLESEIKETGVTLEKYRKQLAGEIERERTLIRDVPEQLKSLQAELVERWDKYDADWQAHLKKCYKEMTTREFFDAFHRSGYEFMYKTEKQIHDGNVEDAKDAIINLLYWAFNLLRKGLRPDALIEREKEPPNRPRKTTRKEYAVHFKSNDGKEEHVAGHYADKKRARASAETHKGNGNRDVYVVARTVTEWERVKA